MPVSQNGYPANDVGLTEVWTAPGTKVRFRTRKGPVSTVFKYLVGRFDNEVEDVDTARGFPDDPGVPAGAGVGASDVADDWSYAERRVRGGAALSNHASGTAVDLNATQHPLGVPGTFTPAQVKRIRRILAGLVDPVTGACVVRWGGDYKSRKDEMHFEIVSLKVAGEDAVRRVAERVAGDIELIEQGRDLEDDMPTPKEIAEAVWGLDTIPNDNGKTDASRTLTPRTVLRQVEGDLDVVRAAVGRLERGQSELRDKVDAIAVALSRLSAPPRK